MPKIQQHDPSRPGVEVAGTAITFDEEGFADVTEEQAAWLTEGVHRVRTISRVKPPREPRLDPDARPHVVRDVPGEAAVPAPPEAPVEEEAAVSEPLPDGSPDEEAASDAKPKRRRR